MKHAFIYGWKLVVVLAFGWTGTLQAKEAKEPAKALQMACYDIVPLPNSVTLQAGEGFVLDGSCVVVACSDDENLRRNAQFLCEYLRDDVGLSLTVSSRPLKGRPRTVSSTAFRRCVRRFSRLTGNSLRLCCCQPWSSTMLPALAIVACIWTCRVISSVWTS